MRRGGEQAECEGSGELGRVVHTEHLVARLLVRGAGAGLASCKVVVEATQGFGLAAGVREGRVRDVRLSGVEYRGEELSVPEHGVGQQRREEVLLDSFLGVEPLGGCCLSWTATWGNGLSLSGAG